MSVYTSQCCNVVATKEPCARTKEDKDSNEFSQSPLGTWKCTRCRRKAKVTRTRSRRPEEAA